MARRRRSSFSYGTVPKMRLPRSLFPMPSSHKTTASVGRLFPFYCARVLPGDTFKMDSAVVARVTSSFIRPVMDNLFIDMRYFYVPERILWDRLVELYGENPDGPWFNSAELSIPAVLNCLPADVSSTAKYKGTLADYFGDIAPGMKYDVSRPRVSQMPYRAFAKIYNDWYHSEAVGTQVVYKGGILDAGGQSCNSDDWSPSNIFGKCPNVYKVHDRFTSALPAPQKGDPVSIGLTGNAPVLPSSALTPPTTEPIQWRPAVNGVQWPSGKNIFLGVGALASQQLNADGVYYVPASGSTGDFNIGNSYQPSNLWANLSDVSAVNVNDLRLAFQTQRLLEISAYAGTRFTEVLQSLYGVTPGDSRLQLSEFLGGARVPISVQQVASTNMGSGENDDQLAQLGAYSLSYGRARFNKGFVEPGWVIGVACIRYFHTYQQGIDPTHQQLTRLQQYNPLFVHIGMQPVYTSELYGNVDPDQIFGYQFVYDEYRSQANRISGGLRSTLPESLDVWHFGDLYANAPTLNTSFLEETPDFVDRTLTVPSTTEDQFILDFGFKLQAIRPLPTFGTPRLIDHP